MPVPVDDVLVELEASRRAQAQAGGHNAAAAGVMPVLPGLAAHEGAALDDVVKRGDELDVGIEVEAALAIQDAEAGVVAHKGVFLEAVGLAGVGNAGHVEV